MSTTKEVKGKSAATSATPAKKPASSGRSSFRRVDLSAAHVAIAQAAAAGVPVGGDPRAEAVAAPVPAPVLTPSQGSDGVMPFVAGQARVGGVYDVPLNLLSPNPVPPRGTYAHEDVDSMGNSLRANGQIQAASGYINDEGGVTLIEGGTRLRGARSIGWSTLRVEIREKPADLLSLYEQARAANIDRNEQTPIDDAFAWKELLEKGIYKSQAEIGRRFGKQPDEMSRIMGLAELPQVIVSAIYSRKSETPELVSLKVLDALRRYWKVKGDEATRELVHHVVTDGLGYRDIDRLRTSAEAGPVHRPRAISAPVAFGSKAKGEMKIFPQGRFELVLKGLSETEAQDLSEKVRGLLVGKQAQGAEGSSQA